MVNFIVRLVIASAPYLSYQGIVGMGDKLVIQLYDQSWGGVLVSTQFVTLLYMYQIFHQTSL